MRVAPPPPPVKDGEECTTTGKPDVRFYYTGSLDIYIFAVYNNNKYKFIMRFDSAKLYRKIRPYVYKDENRTVMVSGVWHKDGFNTYYTKITDINQVKVL